MRFKFRCTEIRPSLVYSGGSEGLPAKSVSMKAVSADGSFPFVRGAEHPPAPENAIFGKFTPNGDFSFTALDPNADHLEVDRDYYINIQACK